MPKRTGDRARQGFFPMSGEWRESTLDAGLDPGPPTLTLCPHVAGCPPEGLWEGSLWKGRSCDAELAPEAHGQWWWQIP